MADAPPADRSHPLPPFGVEGTRRLIRRKARQLCNIHGIPVREAVDFESDLWVHVMRKAGRYNPRIAKWSTFVARICETHFVSLLRRRFAQKRCPGTEIKSLFEQIHDKQLLEPLQLYATVEDPGTRWVRHHDLKRDAQAFLETLPSHLRWLCYALVHDTVAGVARETGIPRWNVYEDIAELRRLAQEFGLEEYMR